MNLTTHDLEDGDLTVFSGTRTGKIAWLEHEASDFDTIPVVLTKSDATKSFTIPLIHVRVQGKTEEITKRQLAQQTKMLALMLEEEAVKFCGEPVTIHEWVKFEDILPLQSQGVVYDYEFFRIYGVLAMPRSAGDEPDLITAEKLRKIATSHLREQADG